jgi:hypothetical protein
MITLLPIHVDKRIDFFSSLPFSIPDELINIFANNKYIYAISKYPTIQLEYLNHNDKGVPFLEKKVHSVAQFNATPINISNTINSNRPFIFYKIENSPLMINHQNYTPITKSIIRGVSTPNYENEIMYRQYKESFILYRENRINKILE